MPSLDIKEINYPEVFTLRPQLRDTGTINMILEEGDIKIETEWRCDANGDLFQFRAWLKNNGHREKLGESDGYSNSLSNDCRDDDEDPNGYNRSPWIRFGGDIITQYDGGTWSKNSVGSATLVIENGLFDWNKKSIDKTWEFDVEIDPSGLPVKENAQITSHEVYKSGENQVSVNMNIMNPTNHGINFPVEHKYNGQTKETTHMVGGSIDLDDTKTKTVTDDLTVQSDIYGPVMVTSNGIEGKTSESLGDVQDAKSNIEIVDCGTSLKGGTQYLHKDQVLDVSATIKNTNEADIPVQLTWYAGGDAILTEEVVAKSMSETSYNGEIETNLPNGNSEVRLEIDSVNI